MGATCSSSSTADVIENTDKPTVVRSSKHGGNDVTHMMRVDRSRLGPPLDERALFSLAHSWETVRAQIRNTGKLIFVRLFETNAQVKKVFRKVAGINPDKHLWEMQILDAHGATVMAAIDEIISNLHNKEIAIQIMLSHGQFHAHFDTVMTENVFWSLEEPFNRAVAEALGPRYNSNMKHIYEETIKYILRTVTVGFKEGRRILGELALRKAHEAQNGLAA